MNGIYATAMKHPHSLPPRERSAASGVTLIELLVVLMIIAIIAGIAIPLLGPGVSNAELKSAARKVASVALPMPAMIHDIGLTDRYAVVVATPMVVPDVPLGLMLGQFTAGSLLNFYGILRGIPTYQFWE